MEVQDLKQRCTELDQLLNSLSGVIAARTVTENDEITDIHILSDSTKSPKQLVRDVQSAVMARLGEPVDYKLISIAQVDKQLVVPADQVPAPEIRLNLARISTSLEGSHMETTVVLSHHEKVYSGSSRSSVSSRNPAMSAATACLNAVRQYLNEPGQLSLMELQKNIIAGQACVSVAVALATGDFEGQYYGIAPIKSADLEVQAAAMAVLSALNRVLGVCGIEE
jgi:hypothetical protein